MIRMRKPTESTKMKRWAGIAAALCLTLALVSLAGCGKENTGGDLQTGDPQYDESGRMVAVIETEKSYYRKTPDDDDFSLEVKTNSDGEVNYRSNNERVATVDQGGEVTVKDIGTASIQIAVKPTDGYTAASRTVRVKVANRQKLELDKKRYRVGYGAKPFRVLAVTDAKPSKKMVYSIKDRDIARVNADGYVTPVGTGETVLTVTSPGNKIFHKAVAEATIQVDRRTQKILIDKDKFDVSLVEPLKIKADSESGGELTYKSSDPDILTVTKSGKIKPVALGEANVIIMQKGTEEFRPAKKTVAVTVRMPNNQERRQAAVDWAISIAQDDSFAYGTGSGAHRYGCYFCGTNYGPNMKKKPSAKYTKTYCCNPFVHAAYAHGAMDETMLKACQKGSGVGLSARSFTKYGCWTKLGKPGYDQLEPGDVFIREGRHASMYCGDDYVVEAEHEGWGADTIVYHKVGPSKYNRCTYVMRYTGE